MGKQGWPVGGTGLTTQVIPAAVVTTVVVQALHYIQGGDAGFTLHTGWWCRDFTTYRVVMQVLHYIQGGDAGISLHTGW